MNITDKIRKKLIKFLRISEFNDYGFDIKRNLTFEANAAKNTVWYNGDSYELAQLYNQIGNLNNSFWGAVETAGMEIRKMHTGLPRLLINTLTNITVTDLNDIEFKSEADRELWEKIAHENHFDRLLKKATNQTLKIGDGAFKISFCDEISELPIVEFYSGENVEFVYNRSRIKEIKFYNRYEHKGIKFTLEETYGYGYVKYTLYKDDKIVALNSIPETEGLEDVEFDDTVLLAVPYMIFESETYIGRGQSVLDGKTDAFDALDEVVSQWMDAIRCGRVKTYIPESLIPRNPDGGYLMHPNAFDNKFIRIESSLAEGAKTEIKTEQPNIQVAAYEHTYITELDMALQGLVSPSTLGIDVKKLDNAESQREKEKTTLYTRKTMIDAMTDVIDRLVKTIFNAYNLQYGKGVVEVNCEISFGEYANPSFEAVVETMSNPNTPMSIEAKVEEIWGDTRTPSWKEEEIKRIKTEKGIITMDEPLFSNDYKNNTFDDFGNEITNDTPNYAKENAKENAQAHGKESRG